MTCSRRSYGQGVATTQGDEAGHEESHADRTTASRRSLPDDIPAGRARVPGQDRSTACKQVVGGSSPPASSYSIGRQPDWGPNRSREPPVPSITGGALPKAPLTCGNAAMWCKRSTPSRWTSPDRYRTQIARKQGGLRLRKRFRRPRPYRAGDSVKSHGWHSALRVPQAC